MNRRPASPLLAALAALLAVAAPAQDEPEDLGALLQAATKKLRRGEWSAAEAQLDELFDALAEQDEKDRPPDLVAAANATLWQLELRRGRYEAVRDAIAGADPALRDRREIVLLRSEALRRVGDLGAAATLLRALADRQPDDLEARHLLGEALWADGQRAAARALWQANADAEAKDARGHAFRGRSLHRLGGRRNLEAASRALVAALDLEPEQREARVTLGLCKFEAYGEASGFPSGEKDLKAALDAHVDDEEALLAMYRVRSGNMTLDAGKTEQFLQRLLARNERCVPAMVERAANVLDDRRYRDAARLLDEALAVDPNDRDALCHRAAAAWLLKDEAGWQAFRARALAGDPGWHECDRVLAEHLCALYRFADALPFFAAARQAAPDDVPTLQGMAKALVCVGDGKQARELLERSKQLADGLVDPWRNNALAVQRLLDDEYVTVASGPFEVQLHRQDSEVLQSYLLPIQLEAAEVLGAKYGWRPQGTTRIEVLRTWDDFSVRTIGFRGFTALGVCFGRLITLVSPVDADLRRNDFMWEATAWHEYAHVLTLGVSDNRVPRWLTEGFSVFEERARDPSWERGMDRELFDAFHNRDIPPVHLLNRLFRGPRILFGYYQGGLIVEWIAQKHGFDKALALLRAFAEDLDTEEAFAKALAMPSRRFDAEFLAWVEAEKLAGMRLQKRPDQDAMARLAAQAAKEPRNVDARVDLAWGCLQRDNPVDAGRWLAEAMRIAPDAPRALLAKAELLRRRDDVDEAVACWEKAFAAGADDFDSRIACGRTLLARGDQKGAIAQWEAAKACWPACTEVGSAPELLLARLHRERDETDKALAETKAYCRRSARAFAPRYELATAAREAGDRREEARYLVECNRIDPFHRELHVRLGEAYEALGKPVEAAREFEVAPAVLSEFDRRFVLGGGEKPEAAADAAERAALWLRAARMRKGLGDDERAVALLERIGRETSDAPAAAEAATLLAEWRRK